MSTLSREQVEGLIVCMNAPETDVAHYAKFYRELMSHDAAQRELLRQREEELATWKEKARWKHTHDDSLELELQKQLAASLARCAELEEALKDVLDTCRIESVPTEVDEKARQALTPTERPPA